MKTKLINCGNYKCRFHSIYGGVCTLNTVSLDKDGKCVVCSEEFIETNRAPDEIDEHTNMC